MSEQGKEEARQQAKLDFNFKRYLEACSYPTRYFKLDWDYISRQTMDSMLNDLTSQYRFRRITWRYSSSKLGFHIWLELSTSRPQLNGAMELPDLTTRLKMHDDPLRVYMDAQRPYWRRQLLWNVKTTAEEGRMQAGRWHRWIPTD